MAMTLDVVARALEDSLVQRCQVRIVLGQDDVQLPGLVQFTDANHRQDSRGAATTKAVSWRTAFEAAKLSRRSPS